MNKRDCKNCGEYIPTWTKIDGERKNLSNRRYCLTCSPYGEHNTKQIHKLGEGRSENVVKNCKICDREFSNSRNSLCATCNYRSHLARRKVKFYDLVGTKCWKCGYDKGIDGVSILDCHHIDPSKKTMNLGNREIAMYAWSKILDELDNCVLLCCRCHREVHCGFISEEEVLDLKKKNAI
jgi:hypothetical protein